MKYFTSDPHFDHKNIVGPEVSNWSSGYRDFESLKEMNEELIFQMNNTVSEEDELYILGDFAFRNQTKWFHKIKCNNIHLIYGNHDKIKSLKPLPFKSQSYYKEIYLDDKWKQKVCMFHYAMRVWNKSHHGSYLLYGHSHNSIDNNWGKSMDVGVDAAYEILGKYRPFSEEEIIEILSKREHKTVDHHD